MIPKSIYLVAGLAAALFLLAVAPTAFSQEPPHEPEPMGTPESWLILPELPETATQADVGAEIYRLVCKSCHGDRGQGLTRDWIAQWPPEDQNCWQSQCHGGRIPPDGFALPRFVPPVIGEEVLAEYDTAAELYDFTRQQMPWHAPGSLQEHEYLQVTAYLLRENGYAAVDETPLDETTAAAFVLHPEEAAAASTPEATAAAPVAPPAGGAPWYVLALAAVVGFTLVLGVRLLWKR